MPEPERSVRSPSKPNRDTGARAPLELGARTCAELAEPLDTRAVARLAGALAVPGLADWCAFFERDGDGLRLIGATHADPSAIPQIESLYRRYPPLAGSPHVETQVLHSGEPFLSTITSDVVRRRSVDEAHCVSMLALTSGTWFVAPLVARGRTVGVATFATNDGRPFHGGEDTAAAGDLARVVAIALDNARLHHDAESARQSRDAGERHLRLVFRQFPGTIWATDRELRFTYASGRLLHAEDMVAGALIGRTVYDFLGTDDPASPGLAHHLAALAGRAESFEYDFRGRTYAVRIEALRELDGSVRGCVGAAFDVTEWRAASRELASTAARLEEAQRIAHIGSFEWDIVTNVVRWSDELHRIYGLAPGELEGTFERFLRRVLPEDRAQTQAIVFDAVRSGGAFEYDHRIARADGSIRTLKTRGDAVRDSSGRVVRIVGSCWDITEITESTRARERLLSLLEATLDATADGILVIDRDDEIVLHNRRFMELWSMPPELPLPKTEAVLAHILDHTEAADTLARSIDELRAHPELERFEVIALKDGRVLEWYSRPQRISGRIVGRVSSFRDVSEREQLLRKAVFLSDATRLLASLDVERALDGVAHLAVPYLGAGCAIDVFGNGGPRRLLAISNDSERPILPGVHPTVIGGHSVRYQRDGLAYVGVPLITKEGVVGAITMCEPPRREYVARDVSVIEELARRVALALENAELYRRAQQALAAREQLLSIAAHEIRGPLTSIHLSVQTLREGSVSAPVADQLFSVIEREDRRLARFVSELLELAGIRTGHLNLRYEEVDVGDVVRQVAARLGPELTRSGSSLTIQVEGGVVAQLDRFRVEQIVQNLLANAIKFGQGNPITVAVRGREADVTLTVVDRGIGIAPEERERIFEPFERAVSVRHYGGLGLGLHIVRTIVAGMGGSITVDGALGRGSTFSVELPRVQRHTP